MTLTLLLAAPSLLRASGLPSCSSPSSPVRAPRHAMPRDADDAEGRSPRVSRRVAYDTTPPVSAASARTSCGEAAAEI